MKKNKLTTAQKLFVKIREEITFFDIIGEYAELKNTRDSGDWAWRCNCIFCKETCKSMFVGDRGTYFKCIECGKHGNIIYFMALVLDHDPMQAAIYLAKKFKYIEEE